MSRPNKSGVRTDSMHITDQYRTRNGMAYELREHGARLTVMIAERTTEETGREWHVEASAAQFPGSEVSHAASTKAEALRHAGLDWAAVSATRGLPAFDWEAVTKALTAVRAI